MSSDWEASSPIPFDELWRVAPTVRIEYDVGSMSKPHARLSMPTGDGADSNLNPDGRAYLWAVRVDGGGCHFIRFGPNDPSAIAKFIGDEFGADIAEGWT